MAQGKKEEMRKTRQIKYVNSRSQLFCRLFVNKNFPTMH